MNAQGQEVISPVPTTIQVTTGQPDGTVGVVREIPLGEAAQPASQGAGLEGETVVWSGRYSLKNFAMRLALRITATILWIALMTFLHARLRDPNSMVWEWIVWITGTMLALYWAILGWQVVMGRLGHYYEMTNRRLFIYTGVFRHRRDQVELLKIKDVFIRQQGLFQRMLDIGTTVVESSEDRLPVSYLTGVDHPQKLMDLIWNCSRAERDAMTTKVDEV